MPAAGGRSPVRRVVRPPTPPKGAALRKAADQWGSSPRKQPPPTTTTEPRPVPEPSAAPQHRAAAPRSAPPAPLAPPAQQPPPGPRVQSHAINQAALLRDIQTKAGSKAGTFKEPRGRGSSREAMLREIQRKASGSPTGSAASSPNSSPRSPRRVMRDGKLVELDAWKAQQAAAGKSAPAVGAASLASKSKGTKKEQQQPAAALEWRREARSRIEAGLAAAPVIPRLALHGHEHRPGSYRELEPEPEPEDAERAERIKKIRQLQEQIAERAAYGTDLSTTERQRMKLFHHFRSDGGDLRSDQASGGVGSTGFVDFWSLRLFFKATEGIVLDASGWSALCSQLGVAVGKAASGSAQTIDGLTEQQFELLLGDDQETATAYHAVFADDGTGSDTGAGGYSPRVSPRSAEGSGGGGLARSAGGASASGDPALTTDGPPQQQEQAAARYVEGGGAAGAAGVRPALRLLRLSGLESPAGAPYADVQAQMTPSPLSGLATEQHQQQAGGGGVALVGRGQLGMSPDPKVHRAHIKVAWLPNASETPGMVANNLPPSGGWRNNTIPSLSFLCEFPIENAEIMENCP